MAQPVPLPSPFHLFASRRDAGLYCAVLQDRVVPSFLDAATWAFRGTVMRANQAPVDFNLKAAHASVHLTGYHLFIVLRDDQP